MDTIYRLLNLTHLEVWRVPNGELAVAYRGAEIKRDGFLISEFGVGRTFENACENYLTKISGKTLVFNACSENRKEVVVL